MSNDVESKSGNMGEQSDDALHKLLEQMKNDKDAPEGLFELLKKMSEDPDIIKENEAEMQRKNDEASQYAEYIHTFFEEKEWHYTNLDPTGRIMLLSFRMNNSTVRLQIIVESDAECIRFNSSLLTCQEEYRLAMCQFITELNKILRYGAFHLDEDDGEVSFRFTVSYKGLPFSAIAFEDYIRAITITADQNYKELGKIAYGRFDDEEKKKWFEKIKQFAIALSK